MSTKKYKYTNHLIHQTSPYLLQHAHNPVDWYPWGDEALEKAKKENKLLIISIGYAACHWCHVMEHQSFEDEQVAEYMNAHFVAIKVDREERPDIDQVYMNAVQLLTGSGGWPLNCIALPDGRPIYGGTYFSKEQWLDMLHQLVRFATENPAKTEKQAQALTQGVQAKEGLYSNTEKSDFKVEDLDAVFSSLIKQIDFKEGGTKGAPKFPLPVAYQFLLNYQFYNHHIEALKAVNITLDKMADGGIYDQLGGGFSRYSTDALWKVPHFEKMLYDNAQLISLYSSAYQQSKKPRYKEVVFESLDFIKRELTSPESGFYSSLDADSDGEEGKYYVWKKSEFDALLGENSNRIAAYFQLSEQGNWEHKNILYRKESKKEMASKYGLSEDEFSSILEKSKMTLLKAREKRIHPALDDKILTAWNALMLKAYADAYRVFGREEDLESALASARFINTKLKDQNNRLYRNYKEGKATINAFLDDYAFSIEAFIALYQATFDEIYLREAKALTEYTLAHFYNTKTGMFYYTSDVDPALIARKLEISDNVIPSSNSVMAKNMFVLGAYLYRDDYIEKARIMLNNVKENLVQGGLYYANWDILMTWFVYPPYEVAIVGDDFRAKRKEMEAHFLPNVFLSGGEREGSLLLLRDKLIPNQTTIYVCRDKVCQRPVKDVEEALKQIEFVVH